jgi:hypothetical protein
MNYQQLFRLEGERAVISAIVGRLAMMTLGEISSLPNASL